jgi:hypothetical protein
MAMLSFVEGQLPQQRIAGATHVSCKGFVDSPELTLSHSLCAITEGPALVRCSFRMWHPAKRTPQH